jgi:hypothetical protein
MNAPAAMNAPEDQHEADAHAVLLSPDLFTILWPSLDGESKRALRSVTATLRSQVDALIEVVATPMLGCAATELAAALGRWPRTKDLTLHAVASTSALAPLATASLAGLKRLAIRQVGAQIWLASPCSGLQRHAAPCSAMQRHAAPCSAMQLACAPASPSRAATARTLWNACRVIPPDHNLALCAASCGRRRRRSRAGHRPLRRREPG